MSLRKETPCDFGPCPYDAEQYCSCEYWCGAEEPEDRPEIDIFPDEDDEECDGCQCDGDCDNCDEYYWFT